MVVALHGLLEGKVEEVCNIMMNSIERDVFLLAYLRFIYPRLRLVELIDVTREEIAVSHTATARTIFY